MTMHTHRLNKTRTTALAVLILPVLLIAGATAAFAEKRIALIIGNSAYETISALDNPKNDADLMREALEEVGFEVIVAQDAKIRDMRIAIRDFGRRLHAAGKDAVGLFYYAGHGVQALGGNYLIPIGAQIENEADLSIEALSTGQILRQMESAGNALNLVILDACRNNPFKGRVRSATRGLSRINAASGTLVAFSAGPGEVAVDGTSRNSPYTAALAKYIRTPNLPVEQMFKRVRVAVEQETGGRQTPWEESSLSGEFFFAGRAVTVIGKQTEDREPPVATNEDAFELEFWQSVKDSTNKADFEAYLKDYPQGRFARLAKLRVSQLRPTPTPKPKPKPAQQAAVTAAPTATPTQPAAPEDAFHKCDRRAALLDGIDLSDRAALEQTAKRLTASLAADALVAACLEARTSHPRVARIDFLLAALLRSTDKSASFQHLRAAATKGHPTAMLALGVLYTEGKEIGRNDKQAVLWLAKASRAGSGLASVMLAGRYMEGKGVLRNHGKAIQLLIASLKSKSGGTIADLVLGSTSPMPKAPRSFLRKFQRALRRQGVFHGRIDGRFGPATRAAIRKLAGK